MKIGDKVYVRGYIDDIRENICSVIIRNDSGRFVTSETEITPTRELHRYLRDAAHDDVRIIIDTLRSEHDDKSYLNACDDIAFAISAFLESDQTNSKTGRR